MDRFSILSGWMLALALAVLVGCMGKLSDSVTIRVSTWLPVSAVKNSSASLDGLESGQDLDPGLSQRPVVEAAVVVGPPLTKSSPWPIPLLFSPAQVEQAMLVKTRDNRYFSITYVWRDDAILGGCVETPHQCARFEWPHQVSEEEAKVLLPQSWQYTPELYRRFFGADAVGKLP